MSTVIISISIPKKIKEILEKEGINVSEEIRQYLEVLALRIRARKFFEKWDRILEEKVVPSPRGFAEKSTREDRVNH